MKKLIAPQILEDLRQVEKRLFKVVSEREKDVAEISLETLKAGGKRLRPALVLISGQTGKYDFEELLPAAMAVELIHTASLIHDDIVDGAEVRRSRPTVNSLEGTSFATAIGDFLFALAFLVLSNEGTNFKVVKLMAETANILSQGQLKQMQMMRDYNQSLNDYLWLIWSKTATLFSASCQAGGLISESGENVIEILGEYGKNLGIAFQIYDDILDIEGTESVLGKPIGIDLRDGTVTMPIIFALEESNFDKRLRRVIESKCVCDSDLNQAIEIIFNTRALLRTRKEAEKYVELAIGLAKQINCRKVSEDLVSLGEFVVNRYH